MKENGSFFKKKVLCWLAHLQQHVPQTLRNYLNNMEPGHKGPVPGTAHTFILAGGQFSAVYPVHLSDVSPHRFPPLCPPPFPPSPTSLRALHFSLLPPGSSSPPRLSQRDSGMEVRVWILCVLAALRLRWTAAQAQTNYSR